MAAAVGMQQSAQDRATVANQLQGLREQLVEVANRKDTNGIPLLSALGSALAPFLGPLSSSPDYIFQGLPGQTASNGVTVPGALDGDSAFMFDPLSSGLVGPRVGFAAFSSAVTKATMAREILT